MNIWKKSIAVLSLGFAFIAPSSCVPPVDAACANNYTPIYTMWTQLNADGTRYVNVQAWDKDTTKRRLFVYHGGTLVTNSATGTYFWLMPKGYGTLSFSTPDFDECGGHTVVKRLGSVSN